VVAAFDGGTLTSDGGLLLLSEVERRRGILRQFAACFQDQRNPDYVEHRLRGVIRQRVFGLALAYEDLNDHDELRTDPLLATVAARRIPPATTDAKSGTGASRWPARSTLNRLEWGAVKQDRYRKISVDTEAVDRFFVDVFLSVHESAPPQIILDLDATGRSSAWRAGGALFSMATTGILLSAAVHFLRSSPAVRPPAQL